MGSFVCVYLYDTDAHESGHCCSTVLLKKHHLTICASAHESKQPCQDWCLNDARDPRNAPSQVEHPKTRSTPMAEVTQAQNK